jgi:hypothetical protein
MTASRDPDRLIRAFLREGEDELHDQVYDAVRAEIEHKRQRAVIGPWRLPEMNKIVTIGLGAAAVVVAVFVGVQLLDSPSGGLGADPPATVTPEPTQEPTPMPSAEAGIPRGSFLITGADGALDGGPVEITVDITSSGWSYLSAFDAVTKNDDGLDSPETVGAVFPAWAWPAGTGFNVYGDPCHWLTTIPETPATTPDEIAAALAAQASRDATAPVDIAVGGYTGKAITLNVPMSYHLPGATREEEFADCDQATFATYGIEGNDAEVWNAQGPGQIDEMWILDVDGSIVILDAVYSPATPDDLVEELRALAESATFEAP